MTWRILPDCSAYLIEHVYAGGVVRRYVVGPRSVYADIDRTGRLATSVTRLPLGVASDMVDSAIAVSRTVSCAELAPAVVRAAFALMPSMSTVERIAAHLGVSSRHLRALFERHVGLTPKRALRITRFRAVFEASKVRPDVGWATLAAEHGYCDQSHLVDEFHALVGESPEAFRARCERELPDLPSISRAIAL